MQAGLVVLSVMLMMCSAMLASLLGSFKQRRSHFWMRAVLVQLVPALLPGLLALSESLGILGERTLQTTGLRIAVMCPLSLILAPALLYRKSSAPPGDSDEGDDPGPEPLPDPPDPPHGDGVPLPDADQGARVRDHTGRRRRVRLPRRAVREPQRPRMPA